MIRFCYMWIGMYLIILASVTHANLIVNGDFENTASGTPATFSNYVGIPNGTGTNVPFGWTHTIGSLGRTSWWANTVNTGGWLPLAHSGSYFVNLDSQHGGSNSTFTGNSIEQTVAVTAGSIYELSFWFRGESAHSTPALQTVQVDLSGVETYSQAYTLDRGPSPPPPASDPYTNITYRFTPTSSGNVTIRFSDVGANVDSSVVIDDVSLLVVPEAQSILAILTLAVLFILRRRYRIHATSQVSCRST